MKVKEILIFREHSYIRKEKRKKKREEKKTKKGGKFE